MARVVHKCNALTMMNSPCFPDRLIFCQASEYGLGGALESMPKVSPSIFLQTGCKSSHQVMRSFKSESTVCFFHPSPKFVGFWDLVQVLIFAGLFDVSNKARLPGLRLICFCQWPSLNVTMMYTHPIPWIPTLKSLPLNNQIIPLIPLGSRRIRENLQVSG